MEKREKPTKFRAKFNFVLDMLGSIAAFIWCFNAWYTIQQTGFTMNLTFSGIVSAMVLLVFLKNVFEDIETLDELKSE